MLGNWEYTLNKKIIRKENYLMTLESILKNITKKEHCFELKSKNQTIRYIQENEYREDVYKYIEPQFIESFRKRIDKSRFLLFSAPGATGKTALAKHICYTKNGIYWDLPENKIAEYSFQGAIAESVGFENMSDFIKSIVDGENFLVIDAFDEAEASSGRSGVEYFLRDLNDVTQKSNETCAILLARTESAIFIKDFMYKNNISFTHYEIGYFAEYNSKFYIQNKLERDKVEISTIVTECIDEQFREIHRIFQNGSANEFLGYAPVLDALAASYSKEKNTVNLLKNITSGENSCNLILKILDDLLQREHNKFIKALKNKFSKIEEDIEWDVLYKKEEQLYRIIGMMLFEDTTMFGEISEAIPIDYRDEYLEVINTQLPQHPFLRVKNIDNNAIYEFTGPAFKDYVIAYGLASNEMSEFVNEFLANNSKYCPSQMLIEFYEIFSKKLILGEYIPLMYNSFKAHAQLGDMTALYISGDKKECYIEFNLKREDKDIYNTTFLLNDIEKGIYISQLQNCYIDIAGSVYIGNASGEARINNSVIICDKLIWSSEQILIEAYSPGESILIGNTFEVSSNINPRFEIKVDNKTNLKISASNLGNYYKLLKYKDDNVLESEDVGFINFSYIIRRIFSCLRSHSKDTPARKMDFIDNRIINKNEGKRKILDFLLMEKLLYTDEQDWLYKLDTDKLSAFGITWNDVRNGDFTSLQGLYKKYNSQM
ncbi:hypothetical protein AALB51_17310 [Lachnospiraceae bacterium 62-26]|jgi:hypothetical protein|uniref:hypothetical protein n=1 Tax=Lachnospiraceae TaxID=186803 RepID=UPI002557E985|nr:hypothetical protein [Schaedlerella arabinosiphila]